MLASTKLLEEGATIPFIARYRKEATGSLDELQIAEIQKQLTRYNDLVKRKQTILETIREAGKLSDALEQQINSSWDSIELEDLYLPYKPKRQTRAEKARQRGLEGLAKILMTQRNEQPELSAQRFVKGEVESVEEALSGARDIIAEWISENPRTRDFARKQFTRQAHILSKVVKGKEAEGQKYLDYFNFEEKASRAAAHRILALFRAEQEGILRLKIRPQQEEELVERICRFYVKGNNLASQQVELAARDAWKRLLLPTLETEIRNRLKEKADNDSIAVFKENLRHLLMEAPLGPKACLAIDPGFRTGCKMVCLDEHGQLLHSETIFPHPPQKEEEKSKNRIRSLCKQYNIAAIAVGNGTAGRETEVLLQAVDFDHKPAIFMVNEDGASVYSASEAGREEFPDLDLTIRGAISIGRRLMDPLAELIKIDPKSMGVGQYQHDVDQKSLKEELDRVVEACVNAVGVNLNTASRHLLTYVSGLGPKTASNIIELRKQQGGIFSRNELKKVSGLGAKAFEQCAGFLRIPQAKNPLDQTAVHPERYELVKRMLKDMQFNLEEVLADMRKLDSIKLESYVGEEVGLPTLKDIIRELAQPGRDPRPALEEFSFDQRLRDLGDVKEGMTLPGMITNVTNFGAFVDIGIKENGLVHISQLSDEYVSNPADIVQLNQKVQVRVISVDHKRRRVQLSMKMN